jgi:perosamine synthetase
MDVGERAGMRSIEHSRPTIGVKERSAVMRVVRSNFIAEGIEVRRFEEDLARYVGARGAVATSTGTLALHLALAALGIGRGDEVLVPSYVCRSVLNALAYAGATPRLCDVNEDDHNISFFEAQRKRTRRTRAVIVAHMFGCPAVVDRFKELGLFVIEDCAHAIGAEHKGRPVGSFGDLAVFSFEGTKYIVAGQGGMVTANSAMLLNKLRRLKEPDAIEPGIKYTYRMTDLQAAVGRVQLSRLKEFIGKRTAIAEAYTKAFSGTGLTLPQHPSDGKHIFQRYMVRLKGPGAGFMKRCTDLGVKVKQPVKPWPLHRYLGLSGKDFPHTEKIMRSGASIPIYPSLSDRDVARVVRVVRDAADA